MGVRCRRRIRPQETEAAVKDIQQSAGLVVDGVVGPLTWAALPNGAAMPRLQEGSTGEVSRVCSKCSPLAAPAFGIPCPAQLTAPSVQARKLQSKRSKRGAE